MRPTETVTAWLAIDDVDEANAPMRFIRGSHRLGAVDWRRAEGDVVLYQEVADAQAHGETVANTLRAGQVSIHASTLLHGSEANASARRRCGLALRYIPSRCGVTKRVRPGVDAERLKRAVLGNAVPCRGNPGHWRRNARPAGDDVRMIHRHYRN